MKNIFLSLVLLLFTIGASVGLTQPAPIHSLVTTAHQKDTLNHKSLSLDLRLKDQYPQISKGASNVIKLAIFGFAGIVVIVILLVLVIKKGKNSGP